MLVQGLSAYLRSSRTVRRSVAAATAVVACALAPAAAGAGNPPANIPLGSMPASCSQESSAECQQWLLSRLDAARESLGLPAYQLPGDFLSLSADKQIFILADLDRSAYGYTPISGLNTALDEAAAAGVRSETDPRPPSTEAPWNGFGSDWASTGPLLAYYLWMYDDGYPGPNLDCGSPAASGCWGHRHVILGEGLPLPQPEVVGVATGQSPSGTALIVSSHRGPPPITRGRRPRAKGPAAGAVAVRVRKKKRNLRRRLPPGTAKKCRNLLRLLRPPVKKKPRHLLRHRRPNAAGSGERPRSASRPSTAGSPTSSRPRSRASSRSRARSPIRRWASCG